MTFNQKLGLLSVLVGPAVFFSMLFFGPDYGHPWQAYVAPVGAMLVPVVLLLLCYGSTIREKLEERRFINDMMRRKRHG